MRGLLYLGALASLAGLSLWFLFSVQSTLRVPDNANNSEPVLYLDNFIATHRNAAGVRDYTIHAPRLIQLAGEQGTQVEKPILRSYRDGHIETWQIEAESGWVAPSLDLIRLQDKVTIQRPASSGELPLTIETRDVLVWPKQNRVSTAALVHLKTAAGELTSTGLEAEMDKQQVRLLSSVRGHYDAPLKP